MSAPLALSERQVRAFRLHRMGLAGPGHADVEGALRANLFVQAQIDTPAMLGLSMRLAGRPPQAAVRALWLEPPRPAVRGWGPRDTLHLFAPADWPAIVVARPRWGRTSRGTPTGLPPGILPAARQRVLQRTETLTRTDLRDLIPDAWIEAFEHPYFDTPGKKWRFATGWLIWQLANEGLLCHAHREGSEQAYAPRRAWFPDLDMPAAGDRDAVGAAAVLGRRYLGTYGPATVQDMAHFFGARVGDARTWVGRMADLVEVRCGERAGLLACAEDEAALRQEGADLPLRLLAGYDNLLMGHADKHWTVPVPAERPAIWRKAAVVAAVVLAEGAAAGTWESAVRADRVEVRVTPLSGWRASMLPAVEGEARALAAHLGRAEATVEVAGA